jgi:integrase
MASAWIAKRPTKDGKPRYRVFFRVGGRESVPRHAGTFKRKEDAQRRKNWVIGELAAMRVPDLSTLAEPEPVARFAEMAARWQASRVDVRASTAIQHRTALRRCGPIDHLPIDKITPAEVAGLVAKLAEEGKARESIRKTLTAVAMVLDFAGVEPNPARDRITVRLPRDESAEIEPPDAASVEAVAQRLPLPYLIGLAVLDISGWRVGVVGQATIGDLDDNNNRWLVRAAINKTKTSAWGYLSDDMVPSPELVNLVLGQLPAAEDRNPTALLFPDIGADGARLRTAIARACRDAGVPVFSPHDLRHRRISLLHRQGIDWARIGQRVGQRNLATTANRYTHALVDPREVNWPEMLARARAMQSPVHTAA